jgi:hypothetical protein
MVMTSSWVISKTARRWSARAIEPEIFGLTMFDTGGNGGRIYVHGSIMNDHNPLIRNPYH